VLEQFLAVARVVVRHLGAYGDLLGNDLAAARRAAIAQLWAGVILAATALVASLLLCLWVVALTWDTAYRSTSIASLAGVFVALAAGAWLRMHASGRRVPSPFPRTARAWEQDRVLLQELMARDGPPAGESGRESGTA